MDYQKVYNRIIEKAKKENRKKNNGVYYEKHHILPRSLFKENENDPNNIVLLTAKEHFICHMLLEKIYATKEMRFAMWRMCNDDTYKVSSRYYAYIKEKVAKDSSELHRGKILSEEHRLKISQAQKGRKHSNATKEKMRQSYDKSKHVVSDELKQKLSKLAKERFTGRKRSEEFKKNLSLKRIGQNNPMYGKTNKEFMTDTEYEKYRKSLSEALMGHATSEETRRKIGEKTKLRTQGGDNPRAKKVKIEELNVIFDTISDCAKFIGTNRNTITRHKIGNISKVKEYTVIFL